MADTEGAKPANETSNPNLDAALEYATKYYNNPEAFNTFWPLIRHRPEVFQGYMTLRQAAFNTDEHAALDRKTKELIILAIEISCRKTNPPPIGHTIRAVDAGASVAEIAEVASLCIMISGMLSYQEAGRFVIAEAERLVAEREAQKQSE